MRPLETRDDWGSFIACEELLSSVILVFYDCKGRLYREFVIWYESG